MKKVNRIAIRGFLFSWSLLGIIAAAIAQQTGANTETYFDQYSPERIYIHFDKSSYSKGETVWFKVYAMNATLPADGSKTVYLDWIDSKGNLLSHDAFPLVDGISNGQFIIPVEYAGRSIHVKGYTKWMMNFEPDFFYNKDIGIVSHATAIAKPEATIPSLTFFPEGGDAIAGINCKIAFKANDQWGRPVNIDGYIVDNAGKELAKLTTTHDGMGFFFLNAVPNASYSARWKDELGIEHTVGLPQVKQEGLALQIALQENKRVLHISCSQAAAKEIGLVHILGTMYQKTVLQIDESIDQGSIKKIIPLQSLPDGILTITVFDQHWKPLAERITFVKNEQAVFETKMEVKQQGLGYREKNIYEVMVPDSFATSLSISVTDEGVGGDNSSNIVSHLLLGSELKGAVYNSAYYFSSNADSVAQHLDLVMLTHGWRRFTWEDVVKGKFPPILYARDTNFLSLSGALSGATPAQIRRTKEIYVFIKTKDGGIKMTQVPIQADGSFNDPSQVFFDTIRLSYSFPKKASQSPSSVRFIDGRIPAVATKNAGYINPFPDTTGYWHHSMLAEQENYVNKMSEGKVLEEVIVKATIKSTLQAMDDKYSSGMFRGGDDYRFDLNNDPLAKSAGDIFAYLTAKVPGLIVNRNENGSYLVWRGGPPLIYIDETRVIDNIMLNGMSLSSIAYLKIFRPPFAGAPFGGIYGAIAIYTKRGYDEVPTGNKDDIIYGYTPIRQFYSPNYEVTDVQQTRKDFRTTLYWNPNVATAPGNNKAIFSFFNNDVSRAFRVVIEGISREGKLTHHEAIIN